MSALASSGVNRPWHATSKGVRSILGSGEMRPRLSVLARAGCLRAVQAVLVGTTLLGTGCFGDWVRAKKRPHRDELPVVAAREEPRDEGPAEPCLVYQAEIVMLCEDLLAGTLERATCYTELLKLSAKPAIPDERERADDRLTRRDRSCRGDLKALRAVRAEGGSRAPKGELGPACRAWASGLRQRCLLPLLGPDPTQPTRCGGWFMSWQSIVQGRPERREEACTRAQAAAAAGDDTPEAATAAREAKSAPP